MKFSIHLITCSVLALFSGLFIYTSSGFPAQRPVFSTWDSFEVDKCASIWLIKRFIAPDAEIRFFPHGETITSGIPFDTPDAKFRRYATKSTYEILLEHYRLRSPKLLYIGRIIHDIEINTWGKKICKESTRIASTIRQIIIDNKGNNNLIIEKSMKYFDNFLKNIREIEMEK